MEVVVASIHSTIMSFAQDFREIVTACVCDLQNTAEECLQEKCEEATDMV